MISKLLHRNKDKKKKDKKHKHDKHSLQNQVSNPSKLNGAHPTPSIERTPSDFNKKNNNIPPQPTQLQNSSHSHDDMTAEDIKKKQKKFQKKGAKKRHSHIGAMRHHQSFKNGKNKKNGPKSLHVPGEIKENEQTGRNTSNKEKKNKKKTNSNMSQNTMMSSKATNDRLEKLMAMRAGKDAKGNRSRSVNVAKAKEKENKYPKKRRSEVHKEPRRHSMFPDKEKGKDVHDKHLKDRRKTIEQRNNSATNKHKRVQYRVKNELFVLYDYYQPVRIIGSGAYAVVCEAINTVTGKKCAVKKNKGVFDHITDARRILREIKLLMHFSHQDIISLIDVIPCDVTEIDRFADVYLIMPKMETTLAKVIRSRQKLTDRHYQFFMYQMLRGLSYMHSANVIHRDLKPENILINGADCNVKITDFGLARGVCPEEDGGMDEKPTEYVVTRWYRSPEVMCSAGFYDSSVDIWSLGCIFAELILRRPLFPGQNYLDQLKIIFEVMGTPKDLSWIKTPEARRWVQKLKPHDGKPFKQVFPKASSESLQLLSVMLTMDPKSRYSALQCLRHKYLKELHRKEDEEICPPFDLSFEFEKSIKTKFGVRHMMYDALTSFKRNQHVYHKGSKGSREQKTNEK